MCRLSWVKSSELKINNVYSMLGAVIVTFTNSILFLLLLYPALQNGSKFYFFGLQANASDVLILVLITTILYFILKISSDIVYRLIENHGTPNTQLFYIE